MKKTNLQFDPNNVYEWDTKFSNHSQQRSQQRGITKNLIFLAMDYSIAIFKQGLIFFTVIDRMIPERIDHHLKEKLNNLVVVYSPESNEIITCYRANNGVHYIKRKNKRLS